MTEPIITLIGGPTALIEANGFRLLTELSEYGRRYVQPNQCFKIIITFVTDPGVTDIFLLEKFGKCGCAQYFATFWTGEPRAINFINAAPRRSDAGHRTESCKIGIAPASAIVAPALQRSMKDIQRILLVTNIKCRARAPLASSQGAADCGEYRQDTGLAAMESSARFVAVLLLCHLAIAEFSENRLTLWLR